MIYIIFLLSYFHHFLYLSTETVINGAISDIKNSICGIRTHALQAGDLKSSPLTARARYLAIYYFDYILLSKEVSIDKFAKFHI